MPPQQSCPPSGGWHPQWTHSCQLEGNAHSAEKGKMQERGPGLPNRFRRPLHLNGNHGELQKVQLYAVGASGQQEQMCSQREQ